jgi:riboflavin kinase
METSSPKLVDEIRPAESGLTLIADRSLITLKGIVRSGKRDFSIWLAKLEPYYTQKTGMKLYPGTLNVHLSDATFPTPKDAIRLEKEEYGGQVSVSMAPCTIFGRRAFILRTDTDDGKFGDPPERILEIATDVGIRDTYGIKDGDIVEVEIS